MSNISRFFSVLFHPALMPLAGILVVLYATSSMQWYPALIKQLILYTILLGAVLLPLFFIPLYKWFGLIDTVYMHHHRERVFPLLITSVFYLFSHQLLVYMFGMNAAIASTPIASLSRHFLIAMTCTVLLAGFLSYVWKISIHMVAVGGVFGLVLGLVFFYTFDNFIVLIFTLLVSGIVGTSRLEQEAHNKLQVYTGFSLGTAVVFALLFLLF